MWELVYVYHVVCCKIIFSHSLCALMLRDTNLCMKYFQCSVVFFPKICLFFCDCAGLKRLSKTHKKKFPSRFSFLCLFMTTDLLFLSLLNNYGNPDNLPTLNYN